MKKTKEQKGITLIALIITIIILLILAIVTINSIKNDGIIQYAQNARDDYNDQKEKEETQIQNYLEIIEDVKNKENKQEENTEEDNTEELPTVWTQNGEIVQKEKVTLNVGDFVDYKANVSGYTDTNGWRVIGAVDGQILLISSRNVETSFQVTMDSNGVESPCSLYGNGTYATGVRSVNMNDIDRVIAGSQDITTLR